MPDYEIFETQDGSNSIVSNTFGVSYHSKYGAIKETKHVFIEAGLLYQSLKSTQLDILDVGFGTGLNAYLTLLEGHARDLTIHYQTVEKFPLPEEYLDKLNYIQLLPAPLELSQAFRQMHQAPWEEWIELNAKFSFRKIKSEVQNIDFTDAFDIIYYDAFAPTAQPELWEQPVMQKMKEALKPGGCLVTYCAKGAFKRTLKALGMEVEALQGPPGKREMTRAVRTN